MTHFVARPESPDTRLLWRSYVLQTWLLRTGYQCKPFQLSNCSISLCTRRLLMGLLHLDANGSSKEIRMCHAAHALPIPRFHMRALVSSISNDGSSALVAAKPH
jgi:hypothetical protein